jgi:hypothetical protein
VGIDAWRRLGAAVLLAVAAEGRGEPLATFGTGADEVVLLTERCGATDGGMQRATRASGPGARHGCWAVNAQGNPVVLWGDGEVQELDESRIRLASRYAAMLEEPPRPAAAVPSRGSARERDFARPAWCRNARQPHERLICRDRELAAGDLTLGPLWRAYRDRENLSELEQAGHKSRFFRRLKACGADKPCIAREQAERMRFYREALARR